MVLQVSSCKLDRLHAANRNANQNFSALEFDGCPASMRALINNLIASSIQGDQTLVTRVLLDQLSGDPRCADTMP